MTAFCPQCGAKRLGNYRFCTTCKFDYEGAIQPTPTQHLAGAAMTAQTVNLVTWVGAALGLVLGFLAWAYLGFEMKVLDGLLLLVGFAGLPLGGMVVGSRVALILLRG